MYDTLNVACDLDGILFDLNPSFLAAVRQLPDFAHHPWPADGQPIDDYDYGVGGDVALAAFTVLYEDPSFCEKVAPYPADTGGTSAATFAQRIGVHAYITARPEITRMPTVRALKANGFPFAPLVMDRPKDEACAEFGVDVLVEDALHNANAVAESGVHVVLLDRPWNRKETHPLVHRAFGFADAISLIEEGIAPMFV